MEIAHHRIGRAARAGVAFARLSVLAVSIAAVGCGPRSGGGAPAASSTGAAALRLGSDIDAEPGRESFRVIDESGAPVAAALVEIWASMGDPQADGTLAITELGRGNLRKPPPSDAALATAEVGDDGRCRLRRPPGGTYAIASTPDGRTSGWVPLHGLRPVGELTLVVYRRCLLAGTVRAPDGSAVPDARVDVQVVATSASDRPAAARTAEPVWTDAEGKFATAVDPDATYVLRAAAGELRTERVHVRTEPGSRVDVTLRALGTARLTIHLTDADGDPVAGGAAVAVAEPRAAGDGLAERFASLPAEPRGRYLIPLPGAGTYSVRAVGPYLVSNEPLLVRVPADTGSAHLDLQLQDPVSIRGRLVLPGGVPIADAVLVAVADFTQLPWRTDPLEDQTTEERRVRTDFDGTFEVTLLHPRFAYDLRCERDDGSRSFTIARGVRGSDAELEFVVDSEHLDRATLRLDVDTIGRIARPNTIRYDLWERRTDAWSRVRHDVAVDLEARTATIPDLEIGVTHALVVRADGFATTAQGPSICRRFTERRHVLLNLPVSVQVRVLDDVGVPIPGAEVRVDPAPAMPFLGPPHRARTDADGRASIGGLPIGTATLIAERAGRVSAPRRIVVRAGADPQVELRIR